MVTEPVSTSDRSSEIRAVGIIFIVLAWFFVGLRCYVRLFITRIFRIDDWFALVTVLSFTAFAVVVIVGANYGTGKHQSVVSDEDFTASMNLWYCGELTYVITTCFVKISIGLFLMQICVQKVQLWIIRTVLIVFGIFTIYYFFLMMFQCSPVSHFWNQFYVDPKDFGSCVPSQLIANSTYAHGALSAATDWTLGVLPIFLVWNLNMNPRTKISVAFILALGAVGSTATIIRMPYISSLNATKDFLYDNTDVSIWSTVEPGMGITASSMACLRPLFQAFLSRSRLLGSSNNCRNWAASRAGYARSNDKTGTAADVIALGSTAKVSRGRPAADEMGGADSRGDLERSASAPGRSNSSTTLTRHDSWDMTKVEYSNDDTKRIHVSEEVRVEYSPHSNV